MLNYVTLISAGFAMETVLAIVGVDLICYPLALVFERWKQDRNAKREQAEKEKDS